MKTDTSGIILLNKPGGITSFKALGSIKRSLREYSGSKVKVGHTGTLDSFAEGLLVLLTGKFTRLNPAFTAFDKSYEAGIIFGTETDTLDPGGNEIRTAAVPSIQEIEARLDLFSGKIMQRPPIFSAVHVNGERAYKKALKGSIEELPEREIRIDRFEILDWNPPVLKCRIDCSKGTYIRSIARDLGAAAGSCARLETLVRLSVGSLSLEDSIKPENFNPETNIISGKDIFRLLSEDDPESFGIAEAEEEAVRLMRHGRDIKRSFFRLPPDSDGRYAVFCGEEFISYISCENGRYSYVFTG